MPATTLLSTSRKTFWVLLGLILFLQTACKSSHENQEATKKPVTALAKKKASESIAGNRKGKKKQQNQKTISPQIIEQLIQGLKVPEKSSQEWLTDNLVEVQKALLQVAQGKPYSNVSPLRLTRLNEYFEYKEMDSPLLEMTLYYDCDDRLLDYFKDKVGTEQRQDLGILRIQDLAFSAPYLSLAWLIKNHNAFEAQYNRDVLILSNTVDNEMLSNEQRLKLIEQGLVREGNRTHLLHLLALNPESDSNIKFIKFLLSKEYKELLHAVVKDKTPWEIAANDYREVGKEIIETFIQNISLEDAKTLPKGNTHLQRARSWIQDIKKREKTYRKRYKEAYKEKTGEDITEKIWETVRNSFLKIGITKEELPLPKPSDKTD